MLELAKDWTSLESDKLRVGWRTDGPRHRGWVPYLDPVVLGPSRSVFVYEFRNKVFDRQVSFLWRRSGKTDILLSQLVLQTKDLCLNHRLDLTVDSKWDRK